MTPMGKGTVAEGDVTVVATLDLARNGSFVYKVDGTGLNASGTCLKATIKGRVSPGG